MIYGAPTGNQTEFAFASGYTVGYLDVYLNGARLISPTDYSAPDGSNVTLTVAAINGDVLEFVAYKAFNIGNVTNAGGNFTVSNNLTVGGTLSGNGSGLTGVSASSIASDNLTQGDAAVTLSTSSGAVNITPAAGSAIVLDG